MKKVFLMLYSMLIVTSAFAQKVNVSGRVLDDLESPLIGVTIVINDNGKGTITDLNGDFILTVSNGDKIKFSYVGFNSQTITVNENKSLVIKLEPTAINMDEVVVVGYGTQRRSDISTAVSSVNMKDIAKSGSTQTLEALQGKVSGVQIMTTDGSLTSGITVKIRGNNSITGGTEPLYVIDGMPIPPQPANTQVKSNPLLGLNPADIASIEILKDAAAAAIYGANGSNGVVLITTKQGEATKPRFVVSYTVGIDEMAPNNLQVLSPEDYVYKMYNHATFNSPGPLAFWQEIIDKKGWEDSSVKTWMNEVTQMAQKHEINASMTGGTQNTKYMLSLSGLKNEGIIKKSALDRFTARLNLNQTVTSKLEIGTNLSYSNTESLNPIQNWSQSGIIKKSLETSPFLLYPSYSEFQNIDNAGRMSPLVAIEQVDITEGTSELNARLFLNYKIIKELTFYTSISARNTRRENSQFWGSDTWFGISEKGRMELSNTNDFGWVYEARLQYDKSYKKHFVSVMGAFEASKYSNTNFSAKAQGFEDTYLGIWGINQGLITSAPNYTFEGNQVASFIGRVNYSYDNKHVINASLRADGSSRFGVNNKFGYFPAISYAWRVSQEKFMSSLEDYISNLRLRASFGMTGNNQFPSYQSLSMLANNKVVLNGNSIGTGRYPMNINNKNLKWENQQQFNIGFDFGILQNRFSIVADFYYKKINDMLLEVNIPSTSGYSKAWKNAGEMANKGLDVSVSANWLTGAFKWSTDFNISFYRNEILSLDQGLYQQFYTRELNEKIKDDVLLRVGMPVGIYYGYISDGTYNNENEQFNGYPGNNSKLGDLKVVDINRDGLIDANDRAPIANVNPKHTGGIGNTFSYKGFELYAFFNWSYGNDVINANAYYLSDSASQNNTLINISNNVWSEFMPSNNYPIYGGIGDGGTKFRSDLVEDGSFIRLQTLSLNYNLPLHICKKIGLSNAKISLTGRNLLLLTRYSGFDPEANTGWGVMPRLAPGFDMSPYPRPRSYSLSLQLGI